MDEIDDFIEFIEIVVDKEEQVQNRIPKVYVRDWDNPLERFSDKGFLIRYRFSKETTGNLILPLVEQELCHPNQRGLPISPMIQLLINLRYFATANFQTASGDLRGISQSTICRSIKRVSRALALYTRDSCRHSENHNETIRLFYQIAHFPGVSSVIDGTHIPISNPGAEIGEVFRNRKRVFSINVQVACDPQMKIVDIVARYPGSMHDNTIFERSGLRVKYEMGQIPGKILGDNGCAGRNYLLTPVLNPTSRAERNYNAAHKATRGIIERLFGIWKRRFLILKRGITTKLETAVAIICATAVLHNLRQRQDEINEDDVEDNQNEIEIDVQDDVNALAFRRAFIITHFDY